MSLRKLTFVMLTVVFFGGTGTVLSSCNTIEGVGEDITAVARGARRSMFKN